MRTISDIFTLALGDQTIDHLISNQTLTDESCLVKFTKKTPNSSGEIELDLKILGPTPIDLYPCDSDGGV